MLALLDAWHRHGGSRLDRTDPSGIGKITDPGAAIMDTAWPTARQRVGLIGPGSQAVGRAVHVREPVRPAAGRPVHRLAHLHGQGPAGRSSVSTYAASSPSATAATASLKRCRAELWSAIDRAGNALTKSQGSNPQAWRSDATAERIKFVPGSAPADDALREPPERHPAGAQLRRSRAGRHGQVTGRVREASQPCEASARAYRLRQRAAGQRDHHADRACGEQRRHDPTPRDAAARAPRRRAVRTARSPLSSPASGIAAPRIAPIAAGPAPSRNARARRSPRSRSKWRAAEQDQGEGRDERHHGGEDRAADAVGGVADRRDGGDDRARA